MIGDGFIKLPSGRILNISSIESLVIVTRQVNYDSESVQYEKCLQIKTKSKAFYIEDESFLDTILKYIYVVNSEENIKALEE